jgi:hypothetical protein
MLICFGGGRALIPRARYNREIGTGTTVRDTDTEAGSVLAENILDEWKSLAKWEHYQLR